MTTADVTALMRKRRSCRAFLSDPVPKVDIESILTLARTAPSGANLQPGRFHVLTGGALDDLRDKLAKADQNDRPHVSEYSYFPVQMQQDLKAKQRAAGFALYAALGIEKRNLDGRRTQFLANYRFFDAPVGIVATIQKDMGKGGFMDFGMSIMALMLAAEGMGYGSTGIGALANRADVVHEGLNLEVDEMVVCGIALGRPDCTAQINQFRTDRDPLEDFTTFRGFDPS